MEHTFLSKILGVFTTGLSLWTFFRLVLFLSTHSLADNIHDVPCCGRFFWPLLWNVLLLNLFAVQHSVMASYGWKKMMTAIRFDADLDRKLYVITSCVCLLLVVQFSNPMPGPELWFFDAANYPVLWLVTCVLHLVMWLVIVVCAIMNNPQVLVGWMCPTTSANYDHLPVKQIHVGLVAFLVIVWLQTAMTVQRFLIAIVFTLYVILENRSTSRVNVKLIK